MLYGEPARVIVNAEGNVHCLDLTAGPDLTIEEADCAYLARESLPGREAAPDPTPGDRRPRPDPAFWRAVSRRTILATRRRPCGTPRALTSRQRRGRPAKAQAPPGGGGDDPPGDEPGAVAGPRAWRRGVAR